MAWPLPGRELHPLEAPGFAWRTEVAFEVGIYHPGGTPLQPLLDFPEGLLTPSPRSEAIIAREKLPLKDRLHDHPERCLHDAVFDR